MLKRRRLNEIVDSLADKVVNIATDYAIDKTADAILDDKEESEECAKPRKRKRIKEEDVETTIPSATPTSNNGTNVVPAANPVAVPNLNEDEKDKPDPMIEFILQQMQKNKDKQIQDAQMDYAYRQQQANKIVADIEDYIKKNSNKQ